jgi:hypothetical protein
VVTPVVAQPAFAAFQRGIADRLEEGPIVMEGTVVGSYRFPTDRNPH